MSDIISLLVPDSCKDGDEIKRKLAERFSNMRQLSEADADVLLDILSGNEHASVYAKLIIALISRRKCDLISSKKHHTAEDTEMYLKHLFFGLSQETVYVLSYDSKDRFIACDKAGEGTVNCSGVFPRKLCELAKRRGAAKIIIGHNHPGGIAEASEDDAQSTKIIYAYLKSAGIELAGHYILAGNGCARVEKSLYET
jgi:DNA repair protein RadC